MVRVARLAGIILLAVLAVRAEAEDAPVPEFAAGQMWTIKSTPPTSAKVIIGRIEPWFDKVAVHVSIVDVPLPPEAVRAGLRADGRGMTRIGHMPFDPSALAASLDRLLATGVPPGPSFQDGYEEWKSANGGIFTIGVSEAIDIVFDVVKKPN
jgi:hypothetical protein